MRSDQWESICKAEAAKLGVRPEIHPDDYIYEFLLTTPYFKEDEEGAVRYYFQDGFQSAQNLLSLLKGVCQYDGTQRIRLMEFAAGYGCITRHLKNVIPFLDVTSCDIHPQAVRFVKETLGTDALLSASRPEDLALAQPFDVVFALSFFSHMPKSTFARWMSRLSSFVKPGGFLIFTTHGVESKKLLTIGPYDEEGFAFLTYSEQKDLDPSEYGLTVTLPQYVFRKLFRQENFRTVFFQEGYWWKHQDVYVVRRGEYETLPAGTARAEERLEEMGEKDRKILELTLELAKIQGSRAYPLFRFARQIRSSFIPYGSRREQAILAVLDIFSRKRKEKVPARVVLPENALAREEQPESIHDLAKGWKDETYRDLIIQSLDQPVIQGVKMPGFPAEEIQRNFVGSARESALQEGYIFYEFVKCFCSSLGVPIGERSRILDFGCGWGRIARFFFKDVAGENFIGVDVDPKMIAFCESQMTYGLYRTVNPEPPMTFLEDRSLDVVFAYSVFSHLAESVAGKWIAEFARVLKPNGVLLATTQRRSFLDVCASFQGKTEFTHLWHKNLSQSFIPIEKAKEDYDNGKFLFSGTGGGEYRDGSFYGEALISKKYIEREYTRFLALRDFVDDPAKMPQAVFVMQKEK